MKIYSEHTEVKFPKVPQQEIKTRKKRDYLLVQMYGFTDLVTIQITVLVFIKVKIEEKSINYSICRKINSCKEKIK